MRVTAQNLKTLNTVDCGCCHTPGIPAEKIVRSNEQGSGFIDLYGHVSFPYRDVVRCPYCHSENLYNRDRLAA